MATRSEKQRAERVSRLRAKLHGVEAALAAVRKQVAAELERIERLVASVSTAAVQEERTTMQHLAMSVPFDEFVGSLTLRARKTLEKCGVTDSGGLATLSMCRLLEVPNCGRGTALRIANLLEEQYGVTLPELEWESLP
jgi:hypothetical protein